MSIDNPPAVDREALAKALRDRFGPLSDLEWEEQPEDVRNDWRDDANAILSSGELLAAYADEVRREADTQRGLAEYARLSGALNGVKEQLQREYVAHQQFRAAIEAKCEESEQVRRSSRILPGIEPMVYVSDLRALLADDGADALREREAAVYDGGWADGVVDAMRTHGPKLRPGIDDEEIGTYRLLWAAEVKHTEANPYRDPAGKGATDA